MNRPHQLGLLLIGGVLLAGAIALLFGTRAAAPTLVEPADFAASRDAVETPMPPEVPEVEPTGPVREAVADSRPAVAIEPLAEVSGKFRLHGIVTDEVSGEPVPMLVVHLINTKAGDLDYLVGTNTYARMFSNSKGGFVIRDLEPGRYNLLVRSTGYRDRVVRDFAIPHTEETMPLTLSRGAYVEVTVQDDAGDGVGGVEVRLVPVRLDPPQDASVAPGQPRPGAPRTQLGRTDDHGRTRFSDLPTGVYRVQLVNEAMGAPPTPEFYLAAGSSYPARFIVRPLNTLAVRVRDQDGNPLGNVHVRVWSKGPGKGTYRLETDRHGEGSAEFVAAGDYTLKLWKPGFLRITRNITLSTAASEHLEEFVLPVDPTNGAAEQNPTPEQQRRLRAGESPADVFGRQG